MQRTLVLAAVAALALAVAPAGVPGLRPDGRRTAARPRPAPAADTGSPLWPEGVLIALALAVGGVSLVRAVRGLRRFGPASS